MKPYPLNVPETLGGLLTAFRFISRERTNDIQDFNNLENIFMRGRKVGKIPTGSADAAVTDRLGDFNFDANYWYYYTGTAWRRLTAGTW